jgi:hypothetical protein
MRFSDEIKKRQTKEVLPLSDGICSFSVKFKFLKNMKRFVFNRRNLLILESKLNQKRNGKRFFRQATELAHS